MEVESDEFGYGLLPESRKVRASGDQDNGADQGNEHNADGEGQFDIPKVDISEYGGEDNQEAEQAIEFADHGNFFTM
jgi:hypothetical protein